ncbi:hypothetical protein PRIPAC_86682, partial [Pristionchus pacificus]
RFSSCYLKVCVINTSNQGREGAQRESIEFQFTKMPTEIDLASVYQVVLCVLLPPVAVWLHAGECSIHVMLTFLLWMLFVVPGIVYAIGGLLLSCSG